MIDRSCVLPRRRVLEFGIASLAMGALSRAQTSEPPGAFVPLPAQVKVTPHHLTTEVMINDKGPFHFVVDTGADHSVIAQDVAETLRLPLGTPVVVQGIVRAVPAQSVPVSELRFGSVTRSDLMMPVLPREMMLVDGYLGLDAIGSNRVIFDFRERTLQVIPGLSTMHNVRMPRNEMVIRAPGVDGHLRSLDCQVDGVPTVAFIDSGAEISVGNEALGRALFARSATHTPIRDIEISGITGGALKGRVLRVQTIDLSGLSFSGCEIAIADLDVFKIWNLDETPGLLIGLNFLREFQTVSVDYSRKEFRLKLASSAWVKKRA